MRKIGYEQWQTRRNNDEHREFIIQSRNQRQPPTVIQSLCARNWNENEKKTMRTHWIGTSIDFSLNYSLFFFLCLISNCGEVGECEERLLMHDALMYELLRSCVLILRFFMCCDEWRINFCCDFCSLCSEKNEGMKKKWTNQLIRDDASIYNPLIPFLNSHQIQLEIQFSVRDLES